MILRQLYDEESASFSYLLADAQSGTAIMIDPIMDQVMRDFELIQQMNMKLAYIFETGVYHDRITGAGMLRELSGDDRSTAVSILPHTQQRRSADSYTKDGDIFHFGSHRLEVIDIPGPHGGWACYLVNGIMLFTGDTLLARGCGEVRNEQARALYRGITDKLFTLHDQCEIYPGRQTNGLGSSTIGEEKQFNPLLAGADEDTFVEKMAKDRETMNIVEEELIDVKTIEDKAREAGLLVG